MLGGAVGWEVAVPADSLVLAAAGASLVPTAGASGGVAGSLVLAAGGARGLPPADWRRQRCRSPRELPARWPQVPRLEWRRRAESLGQPHPGWLGLLEWFRFWRMPPAGIQGIPAVLR